MSLLSYAVGCMFGRYSLEVDYGAYLGLKEQLAQRIAAPNPVYDWSLLSSRGVGYLYCIGPAQNRYIICAMRLEGDFARLEIADTGRGFPPEVLAALQSGAPFDEDGQHIGIRNTLARLEILFGGRASVQFRNAPEGGAQITLRIPAMRASEEGGGGA